MFATLFFFFFKQKTAYEMSLRDWSSDVCSSDLAHRRAGERLDRGRGVVQRLPRRVLQLRLVEVEQHRRLQRDVQRAADGADRVDVRAGPLAAAVMLQVGEADVREAVGRLDEVVDVDARGAAGDL